MEQLLLRALHGLDPETAHNALVNTLQKAQDMPFVLAEIAKRYQVPAKPVHVLGIHFPHKIGLAAGFDKGARIVRALEALGFGFVEVGTITPHPQPGNPRPRIFRVGESAIVNRMGFNSEGIAPALARLTQDRERISIPIGISLGKNKETPLLFAAEDYLAVLRALYLVGDYFVVNISSPNTPDLRKLQTPEYLRKLIGDIVEDAENLGKSHRVIFKPILVKFDPDSGLSHLREMVQSATEAGAEGVVLANTSMNIPAHLAPLPPADGGTVGGLSGPLLFERVLERVHFIRAQFPDLPIIAAGGIDSASKAKALLDAGANLIQIYTAFIFKGPSFVKELAQSL